MNIYDRIRKRREQLGLSQQELAELVGFKTASAVNKIELGLRDINQTKITAFAGALKTSVAYLMGWEDEVNSNITVKHISNINDADFSEIIEKKFDKATRDAFCMYTQLDTNDQAEIRGEMKQMLKSEKYLLQDDTLQNA